MVNHPNRSKRGGSSERTTKGLRDILFDEIEALRGEKGDPTRAQAVANLARQIMNTARVEMEFLRTIDAATKSGGSVELGKLELGSSSRLAVSAAKTATGL